MDISDIIQTFEVIVHIKHEEDLYNPLDYTGLSLNNDLTDYVLTQMEGKRFGERMTLHIVTDEPIDQERFCNAVNKFTELYDVKLHKAQRLNQYNAIRMLVTGLVFLFAGLMLNASMPPLATTVIESVGSFSIWEAANIWLQEQPKVKAMKRQLE